MKRPIFTKPAGPSERSWNNLGTGTTSAVTCELCGTNHPAVNDGDDGYTLGRFLGMQFVEECCGRTVDYLYAELGEEFCMAFLHDFAENPTDSRFGFLRFCLADILEQARQKLTEVSGKVDGAAIIAKGLK